MASSSARLPREFEVFLNFRGEDTRNKFVSHLHKALNDKGIITYMDEFKLEIGQSISLELLKAIEDSKFAIVIFSKNYASSTWCLDELVKIMECKAKLDQTVIPIFYDVDPSDVRKQNNSFAKSFVDHEKNNQVSKEHMQTWKGALRQAADIKGEDIRERSEASCVNKIVEEIFGKLRPKTSTKYLVPTDNKRLKLSKDGQKCYVLCANELEVAGGDNPDHWHWISIPEPRFSEVAVELWYIYWLEIRAQIRVEMLSLGTTYAAYLVFRFNERSMGFDRPCKAFVTFTNGVQSLPSREFDGQATIVYLKEPSENSRRRWAGERQILDGVHAQQRTDGWNEIKLGEFYNHQKKDLNTVEIIFWETSGYNLKQGLIVEGIELRAL